MTKETHDDLDLSEEERAALADDSPTDALPAEVVQEPAAPAAPAAPEAPAAPVAPEAPTLAAEGTTAAEAPADRDAFIPRFEADPVEGLDTKLAELETKLEAGDLTLAEYNRERDAIQAAKLQSDFAVRQNEAIARQRWEWEVDSFLDMNKQFKENKLLNAAFDRAVKDLAADPANNDKSMRWFLDSAAGQVNEILGQRATPTPTPGARAAAPVARVPPTLAQVPPAAAMTNDSEFAMLDGLGGEELEAAVAKLTPTQREKWMRAA